MTAELRAKLEKWIANGGSDWSRPEVEQLLDLLWPVIEAAKDERDAAIEHCRSVGAHGTAGIHEYPVFAALKELEQKLEQP